MNIRLIYIFLFIPVLCFGQKFNVQLKPYTPASGSEPIVYTDDFDSYSTGSIDSQGDWVVDIGSMLIYKPASDGAVYGGTASNESSAYYDQTLPDDQYAKITIEAVALGDYVGVIVRSDGNGSYYGLYTSSNQTYLFESTAGSWVGKGNVGDGYSVNDVLELRAVGNVMTAYKNGAINTTVGTSGTYTDSSRGSGKAGITGYNNSTGARGDGFECGEL